MGKRLNEMGRDLKADRYKRDRTRRFRLQEHRARMKRKRTPLPDSGLSRDKTRKEIRRRHIGLANAVLVDIDLHLDGPRPIRIAA